MAKKRKSAEAFTLVQREKTLCKWLDHSGPQPRFRSVFAVFVPEVGERQILQYNPEKAIVRLARIEEVAADLAEQVMELPQDLWITYRECKEVVQRWKQTTTRAITEWPKPVGFASSKGLFFNRLAFDPAPTAQPSDFPIIAEILSRMTHSDRFCQLLGSAFFPESSRKQVLWLYGETDSGKSFLLNNIVTKLCGDKIGTATFSGDALSGAHWKEPLLGKSLLIVNEASAKFIRSDAFKSLTGDDLHMINPKGQKMFQGRLDCRVFFSSNDEPEIPNDQALKKRLIVCKMKAVTGEKIPAVQLDKLIEQELPFFVAYCMELFSQLKGNQIETDGEEIAEAIRSHEEELQYVFDLCFVRDVSAKITAEEFLNALGDNLRNHRISAQRMRKFIQTEFGIAAKVVREGKRLVRIYHGIKRRLLIL